MAAIMARLNPAQPRGTSTTGHDRTSNHDFQRAASYTALQTGASTHYNNTSGVEKKPSFTQDVIDLSTPESSGWTTPEEGVTMAPTTPVRSRDLAAELQKIPTAAGDDHSSIASSFARSSRADSLESTQTISTAATTPVSRLSVNSSLLVKGNRDSLVESITSTPTQSRSPSPEKEPELVKPVSEVKDDGIIRRKSLRKRLTSKISKDKTPLAGKPADKVAEQAKEPQRRPSLLRSRSRPSSGLFSHSHKDDERRSTSPVRSTPRMPTLPKAFSTDRLPMFRSDSAPVQANTPVPKFFAGERIVIGPLAPKKKDELWSAFRQLDADFGKFASKSSAFKASVVRSSLLPFLKQHASHPSNKTIRPEDLDRRTNILNKWWTGLLEMLHGRNNQSISGTDRPCILDGISGIMERPEWRLAPSPLCPLADRAEMNAATNGSQSSLSSDAMHLASSIQQNVRNTFVHNLTMQMAFVVEKMACRQASASLVTFCGKMCAYAFLFVPGMADIMIRLWNVPADLIRRVVAEQGLGKFDSIKDVTSPLLSNFPPAVQQLGFESAASYTKKLRKPASLPLSTGDVDWWGQWLERWSGRESDLFYAFTKHYHILLTDFLPSEHSRLDILAAPGAVSVQAQLLKNMQSTIHRDSHQGQDTGSTATTTLFDELLGDPDAIGTALPISPINAKRTMAENRIIMLVRDVLSDKTSRHPRARKVFAHAFNGTLQAAVRGISMFEHAACYTLLDLLEEALQLLVRYEHLQGGSEDLVDVVFWQSVWRQMLASQNTMTEIRLYAFLYTTWNTLACNESRKYDLCTGFLLDREIFETRFNHWCPMVRAYYMRLLCWRVGRYDGHASEHDKLILESLWQRLQSIWAEYLALREQAERTGSSLPATNPCTPAPSRRLLIVRTDNQSLGDGMLSFEGVLSSPSSTQRRSNVSSGVAEADSRPTSSRSGSDSDSIDIDDGGVGGFFRKMLGSSKKKPDLRETAATNKARPAALPSSTNEKTSRPGSKDEKSTSPTSYQTCSFKFSLEYNTGGKGLPNAIKLQPPRLPQPAQQYLLTSSPSMPSSPIDSTPSHRLDPAYGRYAGRALAEWTMVVGECHSFFERRKKEGAGDNRHVETPTLGVEVFKRPG